MNVRLLLPVIPLAIFAACGDDDSTPAVTPTNVDGGVHPTDGGGSSSGNTGVDSGGDTGGPTGPCLEANYVNGTIASPTGKVGLHSENNIDANLVTANGTVDCTAKFDPAGGTAGAFDIQCNGTNDAEYFGLHIHGFGKPAQDAKYTAGKAVDGVSLNPQFDFTWEAGSRCGAKTASLRQWVGQPPTIAGRGILQFDTISGTTITFHTGLVDFILGPDNVAGTGKFSGQIANTVPTFTMTGL